MKTYRQTISWNLRISSNEYPYYLAYTIVSKANLTLCKRSYNSSYYLLPLCASHKTLKIHHFKVGGLVISVSGISIQISIYRTLTIKGLLLLQIISKPRKWICQASQQMAFMNS